MNEQRGEFNESSKQSEYWQFYGVIPVADIPHGLQLVNKDDYDLEALRLGVAAGSVLSEIGDLG